MPPHFSFFFLFPPARTTARGLLGRELLFFQHAESELMQGGVVRGVRVVARALANDQIAAFKAT